MRTILHIDMDAFYASIEERDNPELRGRPMAVGGDGRRGVLTTANYAAREFGCRSAMPVFKALELCPHLLVVPLRFEVYRRESARIRAIFGEYTPLVEPLSLDEAYLDISASGRGGAEVAREIRTRIREEIGLTASAGIAGNKMLAKIASDWRKPDGQFKIPEDEVAGFMRALPVGRIHGVGKRMEAKLDGMGVRTCGELQEVPLIELVRSFGKWGGELYERCRGVDTREVEPGRIRKSVSVERTFESNLGELRMLREPFRQLLDELESNLSRKFAGRPLKSLVVKMKFADFTSTTAECACRQFEPLRYRPLVKEAWGRGEGKAVRLLGVGVRFAEAAGDRDQLEFEWA